MPLQIYIYGPTESGFIDTTPGTALDMENLADIFDENLSISEFSLPVSIPWTDKNRRIFGFAERVQNFAPKTNYFTCDVYEDLWPEIQQGRFTILEKIGSFTYKKGSFSASIAGSKAMFGTKIKYKYLNSLSFGGPITWTGMESRDFATAVMKGVYPQYPFLKFAPVAIEDFFDKTRPDWTTEFLARDTVNTVVIAAGTGANGWVFGRPQADIVTSTSGVITTTYHSTPAPIGDPQHIDYRTVPSFQVKYILTQVFNEMGYTITGDWFTNTDFDDLFLFNQFGIENYALILYEDFNRSINPANHVPPIFVIDFLKGIFDFLNLFPVFNGTAVTVFNRNNEIKNRKVAAMSAVCDNQFDSTYQTVDTKNSNGTDVGYQLQYAWDSADQYYSDRVKDLSTVTDKKYVGSVQTIAFLYNLNIGRQLTTADIAYCEADNFYYCVADATNSSAIKWDAYSEELNPYITGDGTRTVAVNCSTLCTYVETNTTTGLMEKQPYLGTRQQGSYINNKGILVNNPFNRQTGALPGTSLLSNGVQSTALYSLRVFFIRQKLINNALVPYTSNFNRDDNNQTIAPYSLAWRGIDGLAAKLHSAWQDMRQNMEFVKTTYTADKKTIATMAAANCHEINGVVCVPYLIERQIPLKKTISVTLVPL